MTVPILRLVFVCRANISRSPYAQHRMAHLFGTQVECASAGIPGTVGEQMDPTMEAMLPRVDRSVLAHRSRRLTAEILGTSDLVLTMELNQQVQAVEHWPEFSDRVFGLRQFLSGLDGAVHRRDVEALDVVRDRMAPNSITLDIADPYRRGRVAARRCADQLDDLVLRLGLALGYQPVAED